MAARVLIDGECGMCSRSARIAERWIAPDADFRAWQATPVAELGLTQAQCNEALQWVDGDGTIQSGGDAVIALLRSGRQPWRFVGAVLTLPVIRAVVNAVYRWVAHRRRHVG